MHTISYNERMSRMLAIVIIASVVLLSLMLVPIRAGANIVILQNLRPTEPIVAQKAIDKVSPAPTSNLVTGTVYAPLTRNLTNGERYERIKELQDQITKLQALIATLYGRK